MTAATAPNPKLSPVESAVEALITERDGLRARLSQVDLGIKNLLPLLSEDRAAAYTERMGQTTSAPRAGHGTDTFDKVVYLVERFPDREWTAPELQSEIGQSGAKPDLKQISNILNYLTKNGRLQRMGRGRYYVRGYGVGILSSDGLLGGDDGGCDS